MAILQFPASIRSPSYDLEPQWDRPVIESPFEDGSTQVRVKYTQGRDYYTIPWNCLPQTEVDVLETFYKVTTAYGSLPFIITIKFPTGDRDIKCRFTEKPSLTYVSHNNWQASIKVQEV